MWRIVYEDTGVGYENVAEARNWSVRSFEGTVKAEGSLRLVGVDYDFWEAEFERCDAVGCEIGCGDEFRGSAEWWIVRI